MEDETRVMFFTLILYSGNIRGSEIVAKLASDENEHVKKLANIGQIIIGVIKGELKSAELAQVSKMFDDFPESDYWSGFIETSGQVLLTRALETAGQSQTKKDLIKNALELFSKVTIAGFGLNKTTIRLLKMVNDREFTAHATWLAMQGSALKTPELGLRASARRTREETGQRRRAAVG